MFGKFASALAAMALVLGVTTSAEAKKKKDECSGVKPEHELKMVTLAPSNSEWSKKFNDWATEVLEESDCKMSLKWYYGAANEQSILDDLKSGAKHGAAMTATGLAQINKNILILQMPGAFSNWKELDDAREAAKADLEDTFKKNGFVIAGWGDVGASKILSTDAPIRTPKDLVGKGVFHLPGDLIGPKFLAQVQGATAKPMPLTELSTHLGKDVQVLTSAPFVAEQLQWAPKINHITLITPGFGIGALVIKKEKLDTIPEDLKKLLVSTGQKYGKQLTDSIRTLDAGAFKRMKDSKNKVELTPAEVAEWEKLFATVRQSLKGEFDQNLYKKIVPASKQ